VTAGRRNFRLAAAFAGVLLAAGCEDAAVSEAESPPREEIRTPIAAVEAARRDMSRLLSASATVEPRVQVRLASRIAGTIEEVSFEAGEAVARGDMVVRLDVSESESELWRIEAEEAHARRNYARIAQLRERQSVSTAEYEATRTAMQVLESRRRLWETRVAYGHVLSPIDAVVTARHVEPGEAVDAHGALVDLASMDDLVLRLGVSELDVIHLEEGQPVPVRIDALPDLALEGRIRRILPVAERDSRLVTVEVALPSDTAAQRVRAGFLARVRMPIDMRRDRVAVPAMAVGTDADGRYVYVVEDERLARREIQTGVTREQWVEVVSGLAPGEVVLATNPIEMSEGQAVRVVAWRGGGAG